MTMDVSNLAMECKENNWKLHKLDRAKECLATVVCVTLSYMSQVNKSVHTVVCILNSSGMLQ